MIPASDTSGPAYPVPNDANVNGQKGMSLRDRFALAAMQGDWAAQNEECGSFPYSVRIEELRARARVYYRMADAMLEVRGEA